MKGWIGIALAVVAGVLWPCRRKEGRRNQAAEDEEAKRTVGESEQCIPAAQKVSLCKFQRFWTLFVGHWLADPLGLGHSRLCHFPRQSEHEGGKHLLLHDADQRFADSDRAGHDRLHELSHGNQLGLQGAVFGGHDSSPQFGRALLLVYAFRYGKAIIVSPLTNAGAPVVTGRSSLLTAWLAGNLSGTTPRPSTAVGIVVAVVATVLMAIEGEKAAVEPQ